MELEEFCPVTDTMVVPASARARKGVISAIIIKTTVHFIGFS
jgi:hypothetical protein